MAKVRQHLKPEVRRERRVHGRFDGAPGRGAPGRQDPVIPEVVVAVKGGIDVAVEGTVVQRPPVDVGDAVLEPGQQLVGHEQRVHQAGGLLSRVVRDRVGLGDHDLHGVGALAAVLGQQRLQRGDHGGDARGVADVGALAQLGRHQQAGVGFTGRSLRVPVDDDEVDGTAGDRQHRIVPWLRR